MMKDNDYSLSKAPPQSIEAEQATLGAMLLDNNVIPEAQRLLSENYFYSDAHRKIFVAILADFAENKKVDLISLSEILKQRKQIEQVGGGAYLSSLVDSVASALLLPQYAAILKNKAILRQLISGSGELMNLAYSSQLPLEDILGQANGLIADLTKQWTEGSGNQKLGMSVKHMLDYFSNCRETPWPSVNNALGGLFNGELIVMGGLPGVGKSTFAHAIMRHIAIEESRPVAYFGPQMSPEKVYVRQLSAMCRIPENDIKRGRISEEKQMQALDEASKKIDAAEIYREVVGDRISVLSLMANVRKFTDQAKKSLGLVIVENLQQIMMPGKKEGKETTDAVLSTLRAFGMEMKIPIYLSSQLNEPAEGDKNRRPTLGDLRSTGNTQEIADKILLLHRPGYHPDNKLLKKSEPGEVIIAKGGPSIILPLTFIGSCFDWEEEVREE